MMTRALIMLLVASCSSPIPTPRPIIVGERRLHILVIDTKVMRAAEADSWYAKVMETEVPAIRDSQGNVAVYVTRSGHDALTMMSTISEWKSRDDWERCCKGSLCHETGETAEILFEAIR